MFGLKPPQSIFVHADGFLKSAISLNKQPHDPLFDPGMVSVVVTNSAFASELYLKCLIQIETGQLIKDEHNLHALFRKLRAETQQEIEDPFNAELAKQPKHDMNQADPEIQKAVADRPTTFRQALKVGGKAFVEWRYLYESENTAPFGLFPLPHILRKSILIRKPEWAAFAFSFKRLSTSLAQKTPTQGAPDTRPAGGNR
jgi:hypothetical protein